MHTGFEVVHSRLKVASSREFIPTPGERKPIAAIFKGCSELGWDIFGRQGPTQLGVTPVATDGDTGAQRRQRQVALVTWMVPTGDWSTQELKRKEAGKTS